MIRALIALGTLLAIFCGIDGVKAQTQVQPYYGVTSSTGAKGMQPVDTTHGLPFGAKAVTSCGGESYTNGIAYVLEQDLTGKLCTNAASGGSTTANQGTAGTNAQAWWMQIGDGTNGPVAVKPASTAATTVDLSLVVQDPRVLTQLQALVAGLITPPLFSTNDPCGQANKTNLPISFQTTSITQLIALSGSTKIYVCSLSLIGSVATVFSLTGGTGTNCGTPAALIGTTSATHGLSLAANGGLTLGNGGGTVAVTAAGSELCIVQSGAGDLVGNMTYVQQ